MAGSFTDTWEAAVLNLLFRNTAASATTPGGLSSASMWLALFTVAPTDSTSGTEVTGGSYARVAVDRTGTGFSAASGTSPTQIVPAGVTTFPTATADWGAIVAFGWCKSLAGALSTDLVIWASTTVTKSVLNGDTASFAAATLLTTLD